MSSRFNTYLRGFLGLLDAKVEGKAPAQFEDVVRSTLDAYPFLYAQQRRIQSDVTGAVAGSNFYAGGPLVVVPQDEIWLVECCYGFPSTLPGAADVQWCPAQRSLNSAGNQRVKLLAPAYIGAMGSSISDEHRSWWPTIGLPGDVFGAEVLNNTAYVGTMDINVDFVACKV